MRQAIASRMIAAVFGLLLVVVLAPAARAQQPEVFGLTAVPMPMSERVEGEVWLNPDRFYREIVRQAVLIVARDEFGLPTRDAVLREPLPEAGSPGHFEIEVTHGDREYLAYRLTRGGELIQEKQFNYFSARPSIPWHALTQSLQETRMSLKQALTAAGLEPIRRPFDPDGGGATAEMEDALNRMELVSQYTAVRLAHAAIREQGETRDLLVVLVRGYANLSQLTAFHADSARYAFAARALLYATRMPQMGGGYPMGYWVRAYASQLFGLTREAAWDLAQADEYVARHPDGPEPPGWVELVRMASRYDFAGLRAAVEAGAGEHQELAALLWFRSAEFCGYDRLALETGILAWEHLPHCTRMLNGMARVSGRYRGEILATLPFAVLDETTPVSMALAMELDPTLAGAFGVAEDLPLDWQGRDALARSLVDANAAGGGGSEPSLAVLGRLIQEQEFGLIVSLAEYIVYREASDASEFLDAVGPIIADHPHAPLLQTLRVSVARRGQGPGFFREQLQAYEPAEGNPYTTLEQILTHLPGGIPMADGARVTDFIRARMDTCAKTDVECALRITSGNNWPGGQAALARWLRWYHPNSPMALGDLIRHDWEAVEAEAAGWVRNHGSHPAVARPLAWRYEQAGRLDEAVALYETYRTVVPDYNVHRRLAILEWNRGNRDRTAEIVRAFLDEEDHGLEHAKLTNQLALSYMARDEYDLALPWAQAAAQSNAAWALETLGFCLEGLGRVDDSRQVLALIDQQYGTEHAMWQPIRTELDPDKAKQIVMPYFLRRFGRDTNEYLAAEGTCALVAGDYESAMRLWDRLDYETGVPFRNCLIALMALRSGHEDVFITKLHETTLLEPTPRHPDQQAYITLAGELLLMHGGQPLQAGVLEEILEQASSEPLAVNNIYFYLANWYDHQGEIEEAIRYYKICAANTARLHRTVLRSYIRLSELGEDASEVQVNWSGF